MTICRSLYSKAKICSSYLWLNLACLLPRSRLEISPHMRQSIEDRGKRDPASSCSLASYGWIIRPILRSSRYEYLAVYDVTMESSFRHPPHEQFLKGQTVIGETLKHRR